MLQVRIFLNNEYDASEQSGVSSDTPREEGIADFPTRMCTGTRVAS